MIYPNKSGTDLLFLWLSAPIMEADICYGVIKKILYYLKETESKTAIVIEYNSDSFFYYLKHKADERVTCAVNS